MKHLLAITLLALTGCTVTRIETPTMKLRRVSFLQKIEIPRLEVGTNGVATLQGYTTDGGVDGVAKITAAGIESGIKASGFKVPSLGK